MLDFGKRALASVQYERFVWFAKEPNADVWSVTIDLNNYGDYDQVTPLLVRLSIARQTRTKAG